jgi:DNA-binding NarL/FixJ family response regulator
VRWRVLIADNKAEIRRGIRAALERDGFEIVAEATNSKEAVLSTVRHRPDVCLLDIHMPGNGIVAAEEIDKRVPAATIVMLTHSRDDNDLFDSLRAGARGYLLKDMDPQRLGAALRGVLSGEASMPRALMARVIEEFRARPARKLFLDGQRRAELTSREWEILTLLRKGLSTEQVAQRLFITPGTVRVHVSSLLRKMHAGDRAEAIRMAGGRTA